MLYFAPNFELLEHRCTIERILRPWQNEYGRRLERNIMLVFLCAGRYARAFIHSLSLSQGGGEFNLKKKKKKWRKISFINCNSSRNCSASTKINYTEPIIIQLFLFLWPESDESPCVSAKPDEWWTCRWVMIRIQIIWPTTAKLTQMQLVIIWITFQHVRNDEYIYNSAEWVCFNQQGRKRRRRKRSRSSKKICVLKKVN